jgi:hypothetical protein
MWLTAQRDYYHKDLLMPIVNWMQGHFSYLGYLAGKT